MLRLDSVRTRINKLAQKKERTLEPWPPDANVEIGVEMPVERPCQQGIIIWLIQAGATRFFDLYPIEDDPLDETRKKNN